jgi:hypothetical protein
VKTAAESGACTDEDVLATFVTDSDLQDQVDLDKIFSDDGEKSTTLVGPNWMVHRDDDDSEGTLKSLQDVIGGKFCADHAGWHAQAGC